MTDEIKAIVAEIRREERRVKLGILLSYVATFLLGATFAYALWSAQP